MSAPNLKHGQVVERVIVEVYEDNALAVRGPTHDPLWVIAALENAIDAVRNQAFPKDGLFVPGRDVSVPEIKTSGPSA